MVDILSSNLTTTITFMVIIGIIIITLIRAVIFSLILEHFLKKESILEGFGKAFVAVIIPIMTLLILFLPGFLWEFPTFLSVILDLLFFPVLFLSIIYIYSIEKSMALRITFKFFVVLAIIWIVFFGLGIALDSLSEGNMEKKLNSDTVNTMCTSKCEFAYSLSNADSGLMGSGSLTVTGYDIPVGEYKEKENYIISQKIYSVEELEAMKIGVKDSNGADRIRGALDEKECNYMDFTRESGGTSGSSCR